MDLGAVGPTCFVVVVMFGGVTQSFEKMMNIYTPTPKLWPPQFFFGDFMARTSLGTDIRHKIDKVKIKMIKPRRDQVIRSNMCLGKRPLTIISATGYLIL